MQEAAVAPKYGGDGDEEGEEEEEENMEDAQELLDGVKESMEQNAGDRARWPCSFVLFLSPQVNSTASLLCDLLYLSSSVCESFRFLPPCCQRLFVCYYNQKRNFIYNSMPPPQKSYH